MNPIEVTERLGRWSSGRGRLSALLAARLRSLIDDGELPPGEPLPTDRALADALAVGRSTVVAAYETLRADGRVVRRQGSGTRVAGEPIEDAHPMPAADSDAPIFLAHLEPVTETIPLACAAPSGPPPELIAAQRRALDQFGDLGERIDFGYHPAGHPRLRASIAEQYGRLGLPTAPEEVLVTNGAQQAISLITRYLITPGDPILVEAPTYPGALEVFRAGGADLIPQPVGMPGLARALRDRPTALSYLVAAFHNPTGQLLPALAGERAARAAAVAGRWLIDDRTLADLGFPGSRTPPPLACHGDTVITIGSLSKIVWGGLRIGWIRAPKSLVQRLARVRAVHDIGGSVFSQLAAAELLDDLDQLRDQAGRELQQAHDHLGAELTRQLPEWEFSPAEGGQSLWVRIPDGDGDSFAQEALRHGVAVLPGSGLDAGGGGTCYLRLHFRLNDGLLTEAVARLSAAWQAYRPPRQPLIDRPKLAV